jgi:uncharacterized protein YqgQ
MFNCSLEQIEEVVEKTLEEYGILNYRKIRSWKYELVKGEMSDIVEEYYPQHKSK